MNLEIPEEILSQTEADDLAIVRSLSKRQPNGDLSKGRLVDLSRLSADTLCEIRQIALDTDAGKFLRVLDAVLEAQNGTTDFKVPSFHAFEPMLRAYLEAHFRDGWIYELCEGGLLKPWAITEIRLVTPRDHERSQPTVMLRGTAYGPKDGTSIGMIHNTWSFEAGAVARRHVAKILEDAGLLVESEELRSLHDETEDLTRSVLEHGFAKQYRVTGPIAQSVSRGFQRRDPMEALGARVIMDIDPARIRYAGAEVESAAFGTKKAPSYLPLPHHPFVEVYNLSTHEPFWISVTHIEPYAYRPELREKLILPKMQRDLLDILTSDIEMLTGDLVEGKAAGNVILTKGVPGVGKTLTAEIYAEVCKKPLFSVHAGNLGTTPEAIAKSLRDIFQKAKRWNCILLLDEADVFVMERGRDVVQNAIVAEFLRTLEYFDGLLFMTSNRGDEIDEAILSRCAAIIHYDVPGAGDLARVWRVMRDNFGADLPDGMIDELVKTFPGIAPRDVKMLLRLSMRVAAGQDRTLDVDLIRQCAMFRGIRMAEDA